MKNDFEYPAVGSSNISPENSEKYWREHKANMTWGIQKALNECTYPRDIAILGAGKCNDIRLLEVMQRGSVENIDLYDLSAEDLEQAISYVKAKIKSILPEAVNYANFNPVLADVTYVMKNLSRKFGEMKKPEKQAILDAINEVVAERRSDFRQYDVVVSDCILSQIVAALEIQIEKLLGSDFREELKEEVHEIFINDHIEILSAMTRPGGTIFLASDQTLLYRGKVSKNHAKMLYYMEKMGHLPPNEVIRDFGGDYLVEELHIPRFKYLNGDLPAILERHRDSLTILKKKEWEWNRDPHELQSDDSVFGAEIVQGVVLKRK